MTKNSLKNNQGQDNSDADVGFFWLAIAFVVNVLFWQPMKYLVRRAYEETNLLKAIAYSGFGCLAAVSGGSLVAHEVGWQMGYSAFAWVPAGIFAGFASFVYLWCPFIIWVYKPLDKASTWLWERVRMNSDSSYVSRPWSPVPANAGATASPRHLVWFSYLLLYAMWLAGVAGFALLGWTFTHNWLNAGTAVDPWVVWSLVGLLAFGITSDAGFEQRRMYGRMIALSIMSSILGVYASVPVVSALHLGSTFLDSVVYILEFVVFGRLIFPAVHTLVSESFYWLYKGVDELLEKTYGEKDQDYRVFFAESTNLVTAALAGTWAFNLLSQTLLPFGSLMLIACAIALLSYRFVGALIYSGTLLACVLSAAQLYPLCLPKVESLSHLTGHLGQGASAGLSLAMLVGGFIIHALVAFPLAYLAVRFIFNNVLKLAGFLGSNLKKLHKVVDERFAQLGKLVNSCYGETYNPKPESRDLSFRSLFLHILNLVQALSLSALLGMHVVGGHAGLLGVSCGLAAFAFSFALLYAVWGKVIVSSGLKFIGTLVALASAVYAGSYAYHSAIQGSEVLVGLLAYGLTYRLLFPLAYLSLARALNHGALPGALAEKLGRLHDRAWQRFLRAWDVSMMAVAAVGAKIAKAWEKISIAWDRVTGRKR